MKTCKACGEAMIENIEVRGQHPYEHGINGMSNIYLEFEKEEEKKTLLGKTKIEKNFCWAELKACVCKKCGTVEFCVDTKELEN